MGNTVEIRGKAKYLGGVGTKVTGITRRRFKPNLQSVRVTTKSGANRRQLVCVQCIRSGAITKQIQNKPFRLPGETKAKPDAAKPDSAKPAKTAAKTKA